MEQQTWQKWGNLRSGMITNGLEFDRLAKASRADMEVSHIELEDGVPPARKAEARQIIVRALRTLDWSGKLTLIRVNQVSDGFIEDDIAVVSEGQPTAFLLGKCQGPEDVRYVDGLLSYTEGRLGIERGTIKIATMIERIRALEMAREIAAASDRMMALYMGPSDLGNEFGYRRSYEGLELETLYARSQIIQAAHASGLLAISPSYGPYRDEQATFECATWLRQLGFDAITAVAPGQLAAINRAATPSEEETAWAHRIIDGAAAARAEGKSAWVVDGAMVDAPHLLRAQRILAAAGSPTDLADHGSD